eukprot:scaffold877_cov57-Attheya_sp.AAC.12
MVVGKKNQQRVAIASSYKEQHGTILKTNRYKAKSPYQVYLGQASNNGSDEESSTESTGLASNEMKRQNKIVLGGENSVWIRPRLINTQSTTESQDTSFSSYSSSMSSHDGIVVYPYPTTISPTSDMATIHTEPERQQKAARASGGCGSSGKVGKLSMMLDTLTLMCHSSSFSHSKTRQEVDSPDSYKLNIASDYPINSESAVQERRRELHKQRFFRPISEE